MHCKNCKIKIQEQDVYCRNCGGKVIRKQLSFRNLFVRISETFFNYDNKLLKTISDLFRKPEAVIDGYINGVRKKYINPISFFGLSLTLSGLSIFIIKKFYLQAIDFSSLFEGLNLPKSVLENSTSSALEYNSLIYTVLIPLFALISWIVFLDKKYNFIAHIIIYLYTMSLISIVSVVLAQIILFIIPNYYLFFSLVIWPLMFVYHCYIYTRIFKMSFVGLVLKSIIFLVLFFISYVGISVIGFFIMLATGNINLEDFAPK